MKNIATLHIRRGRIQVFAIDVKRFKQIELSDCVSDKLKHHRSPDPYNIPFPILQSMKSRCQSFAWKPYEQYNTQKMQDIVTG
jgi:hypothetical protein